MRSTEKLSQFASSAHPHRGTISVGGSILGCRRKRYSNICKSESQAGTMEADSNLATPHQAVAGTRGLSSGSVLCARPLSRRVVVSRASHTTASWASRSMGSDFHILFITSCSAIRTGRRAPFVTPKRLKGSVKVCRTRFESWAVCRARSVPTARAQR
jgi:hypothetical protein